MKTKSKKTALFFCLTALLCIFTSCEPKSNWEQITDSALRCFSNETNRAWILVALSTNSTHAESVCINVGDYCEALPTVIKLEVSFEDGESQTFKAINYAYYDESDSVDGYFGTAEELGGLNIIIKNDKLQSILRCHDDVCRITSQAFKQSYTFQTKGLGKAIIGAYSQNHW